MISLTKRVVIYTAIIGKKDNLIPPKFIPEGCDFICFTDQPLKSSVWKIHKITNTEGDPTRTARKYKILAHKFLSNYEYSVWVDGNVQIKGDINKLIDKYLAKANLAVMDHSYWAQLPLKSLHEHEERLLEMEKEGKHQDDPAIFLEQGKSYRKEGFPDDRGLAWTLVILRRHNATDVVKAMELWWKELSKWSKRDQMSFNYIAWKTGLKFNYIKLDGMDNPYTRRLNHYIKPTRQIFLYFMVGSKRVLGLLNKLMS